MHVKDEKRAHAQSKLNALDINQPKGNLFFQRKNSCICIHIKAAEGRRGHIYVSLVGQISSISLI